MVFFTFLASVGCGGAPAETGPGGAGAGGGAGEGGAGVAGSAGEGGAGAGQAGAPQVRFFVDERPHDTADQEIESDEARWSDPIRILIEGLAPGSKARVEISTGAWAVLPVAEDGTIDLGRDTPESGTWAKADVDGPFWSAPPAEKPIFDVAVTVKDLATEGILAAGSIYRRPLNDGVDATKVNEGTRVGLLVRPPDTGALRPAVLAFGGSEGGTFAGEFLAYHLAQLGYVAFGVGYFGAPGLPAELNKVPIEILKDDLTYLASQPGVDPDRIAVLGGSRGGELALILGATYPDLVGAVVAAVPSGYVWGEASGKPMSAWTLGGAQVPYLPSSGAQPELVQKPEGTFLISSPMFLADIAAASQAQKDAARIPVGDTKGPVLLLAGEHDDLWPSCVLAQVAWDELVASGHTGKHADEMFCYAGAGHLITFPPGSSTVESAAHYDPVYKIWFSGGGTPEANAHAARQGNTATRAFLEKAFGD